MRWCSVWLCRTVLLTRVSPLLQWHQTLIQLHYNIPQPQRCMLFDRQPMQQDQQRPMETKANNKNIPHSHSTPQPAGSSRIHVWSVLITSIITKTIQKQRIELVFILSFVRFDEDFQANVFCSYVWIFSCCSSFIYKPPILPNDFRVRTKGCRTLVKTFQIGRNLRAISVSYHLDLGKTKPQ